LLSGGVNALNQYWERDLDALMRRTKLRPLPAGKLPPRGALAFGVAVSLIAEAYLAWFLNPLTAFWGLAALASYLFLYTPLQTPHPWAHLARPLSRRLASAARMGGGPQRGRSRGGGALRDNVPLAVPALPRNRHDVPRGLRPRRHPHAPRHRTRRQKDGPPDR